MAKILKNPKKWGFQDPGARRGRGFTSTPRAGAPRFPGDPPAGVGSPGLSGGLPGPSGDPLVPGPLAGTAGLPGVSPTPRRVESLLAAAGLERELVVVGQHS